MKHDQGENSSTEQSSYLKRINYTLKSSIKKLINKGKNAHMPDHVILYFFVFLQEPFTYTLYLKLLSKEDALHTPVHTRDATLIPYTMLWSDIIIWMI